MKSLVDLKNILAQNRQKLFGEYPIESLAIFGSYARKEQRLDSDLDLMVEFNDKIGIRFIDLAEEIESIIGFRIAS